MKLILQYRDQTLSKKSSVWKTTASEGVSQRHNGNYCGKYSPLFYKKQNLTGLEIVKYY